MCLDITKNEPARRIAEGKFEGYEYEIAVNRYGYLCGYVKIEPGHPWFGVDFGEIGAFVHGGLTFSQNGTPCPTHGAIDEWWIGFDCAHALDLPNPDLVPVGPVRESAMSRLVTELRYRDAETSFKDETYVRAECERLIAQAIAIAVSA